MKDLLLLLVLLDGNIIKVCPVPYPVPSTGSCLNTTTEYLEKWNHCCQKCPPGQRRVSPCSETADTVCEPCDANQYMEQWNYHSNCFKCKECKSKKGLEFAKKCLPFQASSCKCLPGHFCIVKSEDQSCSNCQKFTVCKAGYGVVEQGTVNSNVKCKPCPEGSFSITASSTQPCQPHTRCPEGRVSRNGTSTSDALCESVPHPKTSKTATVIKSEEVVSPVMTTKETPNSTVAFTVQWNILSSSTARTDVEATNNKLAIAAPISIALCFLFITVFVFLLCKRRKEAQRYVPEFDDNGNCGNGFVKISQDQARKAELALIKSNPAEQNSMLLNQEANRSENSCNNDARKRSIGREESIGPLLSNMGFHDPPNPEAASISSSEPISPQSSICMDSSQLSSIISPQATSPQVNVNITFHIKNGSSGSTKATDRPNSESLFSEEEHCLIPQQEAGKEFLLSVEEQDKSNVNIF